MKRHLRDVKPGTRVHVERDAPQDPYTFSNPPPVMTVEKMVWSIEALPEGSAYSPARWRITYVDGEVDLWDHDHVWVSRDPDPDLPVHCFVTAQEPPPEGVPLKARVLEAVDEAANQVSSCLTKNRGAILELIGTGGLTMDEIVERFRTALRAGLG